MYVCLQWNGHRDNEAGALDLKWFGLVWLGHLRSISDHLNQLSK